jgi:predicted RNase H-like HicB family nuclease
MKLCIRIQPDQHGTFVAICPSLPGCVTRGQTKDEARERLMEAIEGYLAAVSDCVVTLPEQELVEA